MIYNEAYLGEINGQDYRQYDFMGKAKLGSAEYAGWCLSFIEDALEISNDIEIFGGDSAKESCEMYKDSLETGFPETGAFVLSL